MAFHYNYIWFFTFCLMLPHTLCGKFSAYIHGTQLLERAAIARTLYKKLPYRKRPRWCQYYLAALHPIDIHVKELLAQSSLGQSQQAEFDEHFTYQVRVLLEEVPYKEVAAWKVSSSKGVIAKNIKPGERLHFPGSVAVEYRNGALFINKRKITSEYIVLEPVDGHLHMHGNEYAGAMLFVTDKKKGYCISQLDIESYIGSVLRCESWPGWPVEVNKAFAIACRSYLVSKIAVATLKGLPYHIKNTNIHQTYNGVHTSPELAQAVHETKGVILTHNKKPIEAMFDSCCGGVIPAHIEGVNFEKAPYLARTQLCNYCKPCKIYHWQAEYPLTDVAYRMRKAGINVFNVDSMEITKLDKAGLVKEVIVKDGKKRYKLNGKQCYALFDKVNSFCFSMKKVNKALVLAGRGYGHHLGICQWGARRMIDHGATYKEILDFYYPGVEYMKLTGVVA